jgi:large subunit ribosomal protein L10
MVRPEKVVAVEFLTAKIGSSQGIVLADFTGLTVKAMGELRGLCREQNVEFHVVKNRLMRRAAAAADSAALTDILSGPTGVAFGMKGPIEAAKVLTEFAKTNEKLSIKGGYLDGKLLSAAEVTALSKVPSRDELLSMLMSAMQGPTRGFVGTLHGVLSKFVRTLDAIAQKKGEPA